MTGRGPRDVMNLDGYVNAELPWSRAHELLAATPPEEFDPEADKPYFLSTVRPDGRPYSAGIGALWFDGDLYLVSGPQTRKSLNLAGNPACTISTRQTGLDLVLEGTVTRVTDAELLEQVSARHRAGGWSATVAGNALIAPYSAPSAGPPPWHVYRFTFHTVFGVASRGPFGATRWRFATE